MTRFAIEIDDAGLMLAADVGGAFVVEPSPGFALVESGEIVVGEAAARRSRHHPRHVDHRFWDQLDSTPLGAPFPAATTRADLAHAHLQQFWQSALNQLTTGGRGDGDAVLLAVPGWYTPQQLGLLLGIARAAGLPVSGLVDSALVAAADPSLEAPRLHLDLHLHRATATWIEEDGTRTSRQGLECAEESGLVELHSTWARALAEVFVRQTRYDPLHDAASEQQLYDQVAVWIDAPEPPRSLSLEAPGAAESPHIELPDSFWEALVEPIYDRIAAAVVAVRRERPLGSLTLSARAAALPGLAAHLATLTGASPQTVPSSAAVRGALLHAAAIRAEGDALPFVTSLPTTGGHLDSAGDLTATATPVGHSAGDPTSDSGRRTLPTHLLHDGIARPLGDQSILIGTAAPDPSAGLQITDRTAGISRRHCRIDRDAGEVVIEDLSRYGTLVNDRRITGRHPLLAGDRLRLGTPGVELQLIAIVDDTYGEADGEA